MEILILIMVGVVGYFFWWKSTVGYQFRAVIKRSQEAKKAINTMASVAAPSPNASKSVPHLDTAERNFNRIMTKYANDKVVCRSAIRDFGQYVEASVLQTSNRINTMSKITTADDALSSLKALESDDTGYLLEQVRKRQKELLGNEYVESTE